MTRVLGHLLGILPAAYLLFIGFVFGLGANPIEWLTRNTGKWALILLLGSLAITPVAQRIGRTSIMGFDFNFKKIMPWRRLLGLYAFFYALGHFTIYLIFDLSLDFSYLYADIQDRPYITVGFFAFIMLMVLALTSSNYSRKKLGKRWVTLHRLVYAADALALLHFFWLIKADYAKFWWYLIAYIILMGLRIPLIKKWVS